MMSLTRMELADLLTDSLAVFEADLSTGLITWASRTLERMFGYTMSGELTGQSVEVLLPPEAREAHVQHRATYAADPAVRVMGAGARGTLKGSRRGANGISFPVEVMLMPRASVAGRKVVVGIIFDVSSRHQGEAAHGEGGS